MPKRVMKVGETELQAAIKQFVGRYAALPKTNDERTQMVMDFVSYFFGGGKGSSGFYVGERFISMPELEKMILRFFENKI